MRRKILATFGTRPEAIKLAPVIVALNNSRSCEVRVCVTAQPRYWKPGEFPTCFEPVEFGAFFVAYTKP